MDAVSFVLKTFVATIILMFCLQIKVGEKKVETHVYGWIRSGQPIQFLTEVATGARQATRDGVKYISNLGQSYTQGAQQKTKALKRQARSKAHESVEDASDWADEASSY